MSMKLVMRKKEITFSTENMLTMRQIVCEFTGELFVSFIQSIREFHNLSCFRYPYIHKSL